MTGLDLEAIEERANAATPGPWTWEVSADRHWAWVGNEPDFWDQPVAKCVSDDTAEFISYARTDVPVLVARVRELEAEAARLTRELESAQKHFDAVLNERVVLSAGIRQAINILDSNDPKVRNRVRMVIAGAAEEVERLGRQYRGEPVPAHPGPERENADLVFSVPSAEEEAVLAELRSRLLTHPETAFIAFQAKGAGS